MISVSGFVLLTGGLFADPGAAFSIGVDLRGKAPDDPWIPTYSFGLEGRFALPGQVHAAERIDPDLPTYPESFEVGQVTALFLGCARWKYVFGCGAVQGGTYFIGTDGKFLSDSVAAFAVGPRLGARIPFGEHFALFALGEVLFAPVRIGFAPAPLPDGRIPNVQWLPSVAQGYAAAGIEFTFE